MSDGDLNTQVLREIRDEIRATRTELKAEIAGTNARLDQTNVRLDVTNERLEVTNERLALIEHTVSDLASQQVLSIRYMKNTFRRHEDAIDALDERVTTLETDPKRSGS